MIHTAHIRAALRARGADLGTSLLTFDQFYRCPSKSWVEGKFSSAWVQFRDSVGIERGDGERWDCDDYARLCHSFACLLNGRTPEAKDCGLAFGMFAYMKGLDGGHVLNVFVEMTGAGPVAHFYEPQTAQIVDVPWDHAQLCVAALF